MNNQDFEKGFENGLENIEKSNYEGYLSSEVSLDWLTEAKKNLEVELAETKNLIDISKNQRLEILTQKSEKTTLFEEKSHLAQQIENDIENQKTILEKIALKKNELKTDYPFLAGFLYFLAGATFIVGDLIISHEIVAYALNIRDNIEAWTFAVGLASVSILLKPAYERLIEQPYLAKTNSQSHKNHGYFQMFLLLATIGTLSVLGWFRYESYKTEKIKSSINLEIKSLQLEATPLIENGLSAAVDPAIQQKIEQKMREFDQLNLKLVNSPWALWSFVLSGVLFAIAGAICLGIAFPILQVYWMRWMQLNPAKYWANRKIRRKTKLLNKIKTPWFKAKTELEIEAEKLRLLPDIEEFTAKKKEIEQEILDLNEKIKLAIESARVNLYSEGYESGFASRNHMTDEEFEEFRKKEIAKMYQRKEDTTDKTAKIYRNNGLRPYQALRKAITNEFNNN